MPGAVAFLALILTVQAVLVRRSGNVDADSISIPDLLAGIAIAATPWLWWRRRLVIDDERVRLFEYRGYRELPRHAIVSIELSGKRWRMSTHDGQELELRDGWSQARVRRIAKELGLPEPGIMQIGKPERVIREGALGVLVGVLFCLVLMGALFGLVYWQQREIHGWALWLMGGAVIVVVALMVLGDYVNRIVVGDQGVLVKVRGDSYVVRRDQIVKVVQEGRLGYLVDRASRRRDLGSRVEHVLKELADALGVAFEKSN
jgi:hypothetical protein